MYRFFVPEENVHEQEIRITGDDVNHIKNVLRMRREKKLSFHVDRAWIIIV